MKSRYKGYFFLGLLVLVAVISCKSQPATPPPTPPVAETLDPDSGPPSQAVLDSLNDAAARAAQARQLAMDAKAPDYFPPDWGSADGLYSQAESSKNTSTMKSARESVDRYNAAANALNAVAEKAIPRYAADLEAEVMDARNRAVNAGAEEWAWEYLSDTDEVALKAVDQYEAKDYYAARDSALLARDTYDTMEVGLKAGAIRLEIEDRDFVRYDPAAIEAADNVALSALDDYAVRDIPAIRKKADYVLAQYGQSLDKAREGYANDCNTAASAERQRALDLRANVASRQEYDAANAVYNQAVSSLRSRDFDNAANLYNASRSQFETVSRLTMEKRRVAEEALRRADLKMTESDEAAQRAELILEGGAR